MEDEIVDLKEEIKELKEEKEKLRDALVDIQNITKWNL